VGDMFILPNTPGPSVPCSMLWLSSASFQFFALVCSAPLTSQTESQHQLWTPSRPRVDHHSSEVGVMWGIGSHKLEWGKQHIPVRLCWMVAHINSEQHRFVALEISHPTQKIH